MRIVIYASDYRHNSGGVRVQHKLCELLNRVGIESYVTTETIQDNEFVKYIDKSDVLPTDIAIYTDRIDGNPLKVERYIKYLLHLPSHWGLKDELTVPTFLYSPLLAKGIYSQCPLLGIPMIERELFNTNEDIDKEVNSLWAGKYKGDIDPELVKSSEVITPEYPSSREGVALLLKRSRYLYCYDDYTLMLYEAALCGCVPILMNTGEFDKSDHLQTPFHPCIAFGGDVNEVSRAYSNIHAGKFIEIYDRYEADCGYQFNNFVKYLITEYE